jgi:hypothetical protein
MKSTKVLILVSLIAFASFVPVFAQETIDVDGPNTNASVVIKGTVAQILRAIIDIQAETILDLEYSNVVSLGNVVLLSNRIGQYSLSIASTNAGKLVGAAGVDNSDVFPYVLIFGGTSHDLADGVFTHYASGKTSKTGNSIEVQVSYDGYDSRETLVNADVYSDTLTFTIAAN